ncbi:NaeI family type II restriction endonuclease [Hamadaea tsunoensis]|uniref:NaeI family type II restriction endonuclease n=1 Tax=Hamadaea tsunoensis TaxID=53368 RepID=UPI00146FC3C2|nr:NaeI family type II restriction endonuclease [Hamadaea tsunoensis]
MTDAGLSVRALRERLTPENFTHKRGVPSHAVLQRRLNGENLVSETDLIKAIVTITTPAARRERALIHAENLQREASSTATPADRRQDEAARLRRDLSRLKDQLENTKDDLLAETQLRAEVQRQLIEQSRQDTREVDLAELTRLREAVRRAEQERDEAMQELTAARRRWEPAEHSRRAERLAYGSDPAAVALAEPQRPVQPGEPDADLEALARALLRLDPDGTRFAAVLRRSLDQMYDGQHTGRFSWEQMTRIEKSSLSARIELELMREFSLVSGGRSDLELAGIAFDVKFSRRSDWLFSRRDSGLCLLVTGDDGESRVSVALVRVTADILRAGGNRDGKAALSADGRAALQWLHRDVSLPENTLLHLPTRDREAILGTTPGQRRLNEFFRRVPGRPISRTVVATLVTQTDSAKRVRDARRALKEEGYLVLGSAYANHRGIATDLGLSLEEPGSYMSVRVVPAEDSASEPVAVIDGRRWRLALANDPPAEAPDIPS